MKGIKKYEQLNLFNLNVDSIHKKAVINLNDSLKHSNNIYLNKKDWHKAKTLYEQVRLLSKSIYYSNDWKKDQILAAAKIIYPYIGFRTNAQTFNNTIAEVKFVNDKDQSNLGLFGKSDQTYNIPLYFKMKNKEYYKRFMILTDSQSLTSHYTNTYYRKDKPFVRYTYLSIELLLGFACIIKDLINDYSHKTIELRFLAYELRDFIKGLLAGTHAGNYMFYDYAMTNVDVVKEWQAGLAQNYQLLQEQLLVTEDPDNFQKWNGQNDFRNLISYFQKFLKKNYNIIFTETDDHSAQKSLRVL